MAPENSHTAIHSINFHSINTCPDRLNMDRLWALA